MLDIRVWQLLWALDVVASKPKGVVSAPMTGKQYLTVLRRHARQLGAPVRAVEYTLFQCHRKWQTGRLYD